MESDAAGGAFSLAIHDVTGRKVRGLSGDGMAQGASAAWDLRDDRGHDVPAGLYFARLEREHGKANVQRVVVLR